MELAVQMLPVLVLASLACGWAAETWATAGGYGLRIDMGVALAGGLAAGSLLWPVTGNTGAAMLVMFVVGSCGAAAAIGAQRRFWRAASVGA